MTAKRSHSGLRAYVSSERRPDLDQTDLRLLEQLLADPRISMSNLARAVKMSRPAAADRIRRLENGGVISGWKLDLDPSKLGLPLTCYVRVRPDQGHLTTVANLAKRLPNVVECHSITGEDCFLVKAYVSSVKDLEKFVDRFHPYGQTVTSIVTSSPVPSRQPPLPE